MREISLISRFGGISCNRCGCVRLTGRFCPFCYEKENLHQW
jgi:hypothetical protein